MRFQYCGARDFDHFFAYDRKEWSDKTPLDKAVEQYTKRINTFHSLDAAGYGTIRDFLSLRAANDGYITQTTNTEVVAIYWQV